MLMNISEMDDKVNGKPILLGKHLNCGGKVYFVKLDSCFNKNAEVCMKCKVGVYNGNYNLPLKD